MKKPYLNPEISVYKIASENVAYDISDVINYSDSLSYGNSVGLGEANTAFLD